MTSNCSNLFSIANCKREKQLRPAGEIVRYGRVEKRMWERSMTYDTALNRYSPGILEIGPELLLTPFGKPFFD